MGQYTIAVIGAGKVGVPLARRWAELGHSIVFGSRNPESASVRQALSDVPGSKAASREIAAAAADVIVLAVPGIGAVEASTSLGSVKGKILIDTTNLMTSADGHLVEIRVPSSNAELIQAAIPDARVVKGFNTINYLVMADPEIAEGPVSVPLAGDDVEAKLLVAGLAEDLGFEAVDTGPLRNARYLEALAFLYVDIQMQDRADMVEIHLRPRLIPQSTRNYRSTLKPSGSGVAGIQQTKLTGAQSSQSKSGKSLKSLAPAEPVTITVPNESHNCAVQESAWTGGIGGRSDTRANSHQPEFSGTRA